ncbi:MAG: GNAT family N-acetyltransferase [Gammaproteobacteria bacterium]|nr:GNAT family N-acetyltransferase [Gammaproteobacteria bacterium]MBU2236764.1 GNAT family N-acetyltransferase [Gammaproteobacteria bacterium]MBU2319010.1 GNAT family N-acetyltransferase [Gammaproteobacteria bacterium]MBU2415312.1 GNAT family N-acetyltransferase [Gammaproteobacteria bacterium]
MTDRVNLRPAEMKDAETLFVWRNDPETRKASRNSDEVIFESHLAWLDSSLSNTSKRLLWIAEVNGVAVGTCRADRVENAWELSWTVAPEARGKGFAHQMLSKLVHYFDEPLVALVKVGNIASMKVAERAGFVLKQDTEQEGDILLYTRRPS